MGASASEVVVVTVATDSENHGLKRYLESAERYGITPVVLGLEEDWKGGDTRIEAVSLIIDLSEHISEPSLSFRSRAVVRRFAS